MMQKLYNKVKNKRCEIDKGEISLHQKCAKVFQTDLKDAFLQIQSILM